MILPGLVLYAMLLVGVVDGFMVAKSRPGTSLSATSFEGFSSNWRDARTTLVGAFLSLVLSHANPSLAAGGDSTPDTSSISSITRLKACEPNTNCISSNYKEPPNRYMSPLQLVNERDEAFRRAVRDLSTAATAATTSKVDILQVVPKDYYIHLTVPGTAPQSVDDIELLYSAEGVVNLRCQARVTLPPPPFCIKKNCINGNMDQRQRTEHVAFDILGLPAANQEQMQAQAKWTPIFFNSDRVPDMVDHDADDFF